ncbi:MAG: hypothetical protein KGZ37_09245 [Nitrosarchaeum sp.]|nr:hypothetical protein [Nitrosarchaeum sp.]
MTSQKELSKINRMVKIIEDAKVISKVQLVMRSGLSISYYEKLKPYMEEIYSHKIKYDRSEKVWRSIEQSTRDGDNTYE